MFNKLEDWIKNKVAEEDIQYLENPVEEHDASLLHDALKLKDRLIEHTNNGDKVAIIADYDSDGMNSAAILTILMRNIEMEHKVYIPDRVIDGYGLSNRLVDLSINDGCDFILTCDNGIAANESIEYAKSLNIPVYVTDHHEPRETLPPADLIVHPMLGNYPWDGLSGGAVTYKLASLFFDDYSFSEKDINIIKSCSTISLISDVMDLYPSKYNENRLMVMEGLNIMRTKDVGALDVLIKEINQTKEFLTETSIGFFIGPTLNASGRIGSPYLPYSLLVEEDMDKAKLIAEEMVAINVKRKAITKSVQDSVDKKLISTHPVHVVLEDDVHEGIIGLIAGNITSKHNVPSVVLTQTRDHESGRKMLKGSCRSSTYSIYKLLESVDQSIFVGWGGHSQAAGVTIFADRLDDFKKQMIENALDMHKNYKSPEEFYINADIFDLQEFYDEIESIRPLGQGFMPPLAKGNIEIKNVNIYHKSGHVKYETEDEKVLWNFKSANDDETKKLVLNSRVLSNNVKYLMNKEGLSEEEAYAIRSEKLTHTETVSGKVRLYNLEVVFSIENGENFFTKEYETVANLVSMMYEPDKEVTKDVPGYEEYKIDVNSVVNLLLGKGDN